MSSTPEQRAFYAYLSTSLQLDDWILCHVRHKTYVTESGKRNGSSSSFESPLPCDLEEHGEEEEENSNNNTQIMDHLKDYEIIFQESEAAVNGNGHQDLETYKQPSMSNGNYDSKENMNSCVKDALETIKRVLSLGALDEQEQSEHPNKRFCFLTTSSYKENSVRDDQMC